MQQVILQPAVCGLRFAVCKIVANADSLAKKFAIYAALRRSMTPSQQIFTANPVFRDIGRTGIYGKLRQWLS